MAVLDLQVPSVSAATVSHVLEPIVDAELEIFEEASDVGAPALVSAENKAKQCSNRCCNLSRVIIAFAA